MSDEEKKNLPEKREDPETTFPEELSGVPAEVRQFMSYMGPMPNPIHEKLTSDHITTLINASVSDDERRHKFLSSGRWIKMIYFLVGIIALALLTVYLLPYNEEVYLKVVEWVAIFAGGFGLGRTLKKGSDN